MVTIREFLDNSADWVVELCERVHEWALDRLDQHNRVDGSGSEDRESGGHRGEDPPDNVSLGDLGQEGHDDRRLSVIQEEEGGGPAEQDENNELPNAEDPPPPYQEVVNNDDHNIHNNEEEEDTGDRQVDDDRVMGEEEPLGDLPPEAYDFPGYYVPASAPQLPSGPG